MLKVYLAGPDVFLANAWEVLAAKAKIAKEAGFVPMVPADLDVSPGTTLVEWGTEISRLDEEMMCGSDLIIANLTPFRGISADAGTVFELAFMAALGKPVFGYSNSSKTYLERNSDHYGGKLAKLSEESYAAPDGTRVENFGMPENLMVDGGIRSRNGVFITEEVAPDRVWVDLKSFTRCVEAAAGILLGGKERMAQ